MQYKQQIAHWFDQRINYDDEFTRYRALKLVQLTHPWLKPQQTILDVATGTGIVAIAVVQLFNNTREIIGIDISQGMLAQAKAKIKKEKLDNIKLIKGDIEEMSFNHHSFDGIYCSSALTLLSNVTEALETWYDWLSEGGFLAFTCYSPDSFFCPLILQLCAKQGLTLKNIHELLGSPAKCQQILQSIGFKDITVVTEQLGKYLPLEEAQHAWKGDWVDPQGDPLSQLTPLAKKRLIEQFKEEVARKATLKGVWHELETFFVTARK
ncbi:MAG: class I SAM-dependent methyltransferase [Microcystaceae cyanobacterium]